MEIKKGISQMAEYPNAEINYVVPADGKMYYVLKNGELKNGCIIAALDPKKAIDDGIYCDSIGVFSADGSTLIDFNKKEIRAINDEFVLAVNAIPTSEDVINSLKNENDEISKAMLKNGSTTIVDRMMIEMGITGELLFSDAYSEANVYKLDEANHKFGLDSSFIGMNDTNFYFHSNDVSKETVIIDFTGEKHEDKPEEKGFSMPEFTMENNEPIESKDNNVSIENENTETKPEINNEQVETSVKEENTQNIDNSVNFDDSLKLDISQNILGGFNMPETDNIPINENEENQEEIETKNNIELNEKSNLNSDKVLDSAIEVMKKMIGETNKLNEKIAELEKQLENKEQELEEKNNIIAAQESKKNELSDLLDEANEVLENIE